MHSAHPQALPTHALVTLHKAKAVQLRVISGCVWLTESHDLKDHFLQAGDTFCLLSERAVVQAQQDSLIVWEHAANSPSTHPGTHKAPARSPGQVPSLIALCWPRLKRPHITRLQRPFSG